jgi:hypothetical protein
MTTPLKEVLNSKLKKESGNIGRCAADGYSRKQSEFLLVFTETRPVNGADAEKRR